MASDKNVNIKITADSKEAEKGLNKVTAAMNKLGKSSTLKGITNLSSAVTSSISAFGSLKSAVEGVISAVEECSAAYAKQRSAEVALETAARNNPYLNSSGVKALKQYATELSKAAGIADEDLLQAMTKLAATGRTESEIMKMMGVAADVAASGTMGFEQALDALNKSFQGSAGSLSDIAAGVQNLTAEELKAGAAIEAVGKAYKGAGDSMSSFTGGAERLQNAVNSLKEGLGGITAESLNAFKTNVAAIIEGFNVIFTRLNELNSAKATIAALADKENKTVSEELELALAEMRTLTDAIGRKEIEITEGIRRWTTPATGGEDVIQSTIDKEMEQNKDLQALYAQKKELSERIKELEELERQSTLAPSIEPAAGDSGGGEADELTDDQKAQAMIDAYKARIAALREEIEVRRELGDEITELAEKEEIAAEMYKGLIDLVADSEGVITTNNPFFKAEKESLAELTEWIEANRPSELIEEEDTRLAELKAAIEAATPGADEWRKLSDTILDVTGQFAALKNELPQAEAAALEEQIEALKESLTAPALEGWSKLKKEAEDVYARIAELEAERTGAAKQGKYDLADEYTKEIVRLNEVAAEKSAEAWDAYVSEMKEKMSSLVSSISSNLSQVTSTLSSACDLMLETSENRLSATLDKLEIAYLSGEMDEEEYNEAVLKAKKEAAQEEYKIEMWQWSASLLTATANIAEGVTKAIAQGGTAGLVTGALVTAAGAVQLASIIASKPTPPTYSTGGIVGGNSYHGDHVQALLNSGEMVLNAGQQRNLFDSINSGNISKRAASGAASGTSVIVNNAASNIVSAQPEVSDGQIKVMIDMRVNESLKRGRYSKALTQAEQSKSGKWYGS